MWAALGLAGLAAGLQTLFGPTVVTLSLGPWTVAAALGLAGLLISVGGAQQSAHRKSSRAIGAEEFAAAGLGPVPRGQPAPALYLDLLKRTLINVVYYESSQALWVYGPDKLFRLSDGFELQSRVVGEDMPGNAMSMVGLKRLDNLEQVRPTSPHHHHPHPPPPDRTTGTLQLLSAAAAPPGDPDHPPLPSRSAFGGCWTKTSRATSSRRERARVARASSCGRC